jgi:hypothetical protein
MKLLNLILYSDVPDYNLMRDQLRRYLPTVPNMTYYFYRFEPGLKSEYTITNDLILIRGTESYWPGVLNKTIRALELVAGSAFDYLIRTNISTVVDFKALRALLNRTPITYGGQEIIYQTKSLVKHIKDKGYLPQNEDLHYITGICIVLSKKMVQTIIQNKARLRPCLVDDAALGLLARDLKIRITNIEKIVSVNGASPQGKIIYRNKSSNRAIDINRMHDQVNTLLRA